MKYDIFLAGVWEQYAPFPYKSMIKERFKGYRIYDPEDYEDNNWFERNYFALKETGLFFILACPIPNSMASVEAGLFYEMHTEEDGHPLDNLVMVFPKELEPKFGKYAGEKYGKVFEDMEDALEYMGKLL